MTRFDNTPNPQRRAWLQALAGTGFLAPLAGCGSSSGATATGPTPGPAPQFVHPGGLHTQADFDRMRQKVAANASPWVDSWNILVANSHASLGWNPNPQAVASRGNDGTHPDNSATLFNDVAAAYACALRWKISGDTAYADKAVQIMNAWASTLTLIGGTTGANSDYDGILLAGLQGYQFANAGEIMRSYAGWAAADLAKFQALMKNVFYPVNHGALPGDLVVYSNWDLCCVASIMAIGLLCDDQALFDEAVNYFKAGLGNGCIAQTVFYLHPGHFGQTQESGRDQGHDTLSIALLGVICEMAWNQGVDLYGWDNNRVLAAAEYVAKGNLIESGSSYYSMPFATYRNRNSTNTVFATGSQGTLRPCWAVLYNHYVNRKGLAAPYTQKMAAAVAPEGGGGNYGPNSGGYDQLGYGTLTSTRDPIASGAAPSGLTAAVSAGSVELSWWGSAYASSYTVKRSSTPGGPYASVATGITDLLSYTDSGLAIGSYYYVVTALSASGETAASNEVTAITATQLHTRLAFDESSGTSAADSSGHANTGTLMGAASWAAGKSGNAVLLDGSTGYVSLGVGLLADVADFSIAAWVWCNSATAWQRVFDFGSDINHYMLLSPHGGSGVLRFAITVNGQYGEDVINGNAALPTGQWVHVAVTLAGSVGTLYVNGAAVGSNPSIRFAPWRLGRTTQNWIGRSQYSADPFFNGKIDEFRIYRGALTDAQVLALASA